MGHFDYDNTAIFRWRSYISLRKIFHQGGCINFIAINSYPYTKKISIFATDFSPQGGNISHRDNTALLQQITHFVVIQFCDLNELLQVQFLFIKWSCSPRVKKRNPNIYMSLTILGGVRRLP